MAHGQVTKAAKFQNNKAVKTASIQEIISHTTLQIIITINVYYSTHNVTSLQKNHAINHIAKITRNFDMQ